MTSPWSRLQRDAAEQVPLRGSDREAEDGAATWRQARCLLPGLPDTQTHHPHGERACSPRRRKLSAQGGTTGPEQAPSKSIHPSPKSVGPHPLFAAGNILTEQILVSRVQTAEQCIDTFVRLLPSVAGKAEEGRREGVSDEQPRRQHDAADHTQADAGEQRRFLARVHGCLLPESAVVCLPDCLAVVDSPDFPAVSQDLEQVAQELIGKTLYVGWPHLVEARVVSCTDGEWM